jgi:hypothetical protein
MSKLLIILTLFFSLPAFSQKNPLLEACNNISEPSKRLECLEELFRRHTQPQSSNAKIRLKEKIIGFQSAIDSQISLQQFRSLRSELAQEIGIYRASQNPDPAVLEPISEALKAYTDAEVFWTTNIQRGTSDGYILLRDMTSFGMAGFIEKYNIPLVDLNWNKWVTRANGLNAILLYAKGRANVAIVSL